MKKIVYSLRYRKKLKDIKKHIELRFGQDTCKNVLQTITDRLRLLKRYAESGVSIKKIYGVDTDYRYVFIAHNYIFYKIEDDIIRIVAIYNEKEDFMLDLFGISSIDPDAEAYWEMVEQQKQGED